MQANFHNCFFNYNYCPVNGTVSSETKAFDINSNWGVNAIYLLSLYYLTTGRDDYAINSPLFIKMHERYGADMAIVNTATRILMICSAAILLMITVLMLWFGAPSSPQNTVWFNVALTAIAFCAVLFFILMQHFTSQYST